MRLILHSFSLPPSLLSLSSIHSSIVRVRWRFPRPRLHDYTSEGRREDSQQEIHCETSRQPTTNNAPSSQPKTYFQDQETCPINPMSESSPAGDWKAVQMDPTRHQISHDVGPRQVRFEAPMHRQGQQSSSTSTMDRIFCNPWNCGDQHEQHIPHASMVPSESHQASSGSGSGNHPPQDRFGSCYSCIGSIPLHMERGSSRHSNGYHDHQERQLCYPHPRPFRVDGRNSRQGQPTGPAMPPHSLQHPWSSHSFQSQQHFNYCPPILPQAMERGPLEEEEALRTVDDDVADPGPVPCQLPDPNAVGIPVAPQLATNRFHPPHGHSLQYPFQQNYLPAHHLAPSEREMGGGMRQHATFPFPPSQHSDTVPLLHSMQSWTEDLLKILLMASLLMVQMGLLWI